MPSIRSKSGDEACVTCFKGNKKCEKIDGLCCTQCAGILVNEEITPEKLREIEQTQSENEELARKNLLNCRDDCKSYLRTKFHRHATTMNLAFNHNLPHVLACRILPHRNVASDIDVAITHTINYEGEFSVENSNLVHQLDQMVFGTWSPKIETDDVTLKSIYFSCLCIAYINMAFCANLSDNSNSPRNNQGFSAALTHFVLLRIDELIMDIIRSVPDVPGEIDLDSRPNLDALYLYLSMVPGKLTKLGRSKIHDDHKLFLRVRKTCKAFGEWLKARLQIDCKTEIPWGDAFTGYKEGCKKGSKNKLLSKLSIAELWTLSLDVVSRDSSISNNTNSHSPTPDSTISSTSSTGRDALDTTSFENLPKISMPCSNQSSETAASSRPNVFLSSHDYPETDNTAQFSSILDYMITELDNRDMLVSNGYNISCHKATQHDSFDRNNSNDFSEDHINDCELQPNIFDDPQTSQSPPTLDPIAMGSQNVPFASPTFDMASYSFNIVTKSQSPAFGNFGESLFCANNNQTPFSSPSTALEDNCSDPFGEFMGSSLAADDNLAQKLSHTEDYLINKPVVDQLNPQQHDTYDHRYVDVFNLGLLNPEP